MPFLLVQKPAGITSHDAVDHIRRITGEQRVGHAGTLDPFATGLLIIGVSRDATKHLAMFLGMDKSYRATVVLGADSTTLDPEGEITDVTKDPTMAKEVTKSAILASLQTQKGDLQQIPPMYSAIKIGGKKLYTLARQGIEIDRPPRAVRISHISLSEEDTTLLKNKGPIRLPVSLSIDVDCSSGTYIRAVARDIAAQLQTKGYLSALERTRIGEFSNKDATPLMELTPKNWADLAKSIFTC